MITFRCDKVKDISPRWVFQPEQRESDSELLWILVAADFGVLYGACHFLEIMCV